MNLEMRGGRIPTSTVPANETSRTLEREKLTPDLWPRLCRCSSACLRRCSHRLAGGHTRSHRERGGRQLYTFSLRRSCASASCCGGCEVERQVVPRSRLPEAYRLHWGCRRRTRSCKGDHRSLYGPRRCA